MNLDISPSGQSCGASVRGLDLREELDEDTIAAIRSAWLDHRVLAFPAQQLTDDDLERFTLYFGPFGDDPYFAAIDGSIRQAVYSGSSVTYIVAVGDREFRVFQQNRETEPLAVGAAVALCWAPEHSVVLEA